MRVEQIAKAIQATIYNEEVLLQADIKGVFIGDLLSLVMANAKEGQIWLTVQGHVNAVAVAVLEGIPAIVLVQGILPSEEMCQKAKEENIVLLGTPLSAYEVAKILTQWF